MSIIGVIYNNVKYTFNDFISYAFSGNTAVAPQIALSLKDSMTKEHALISISGVGSTCPRKLIWSKWYDTYESYIGCLRMGFGTAFHSMMEEVEHAQILYKELKTSININGYDISGTIDVVWKDSSGCIHVSDHKTTKAPQYAMRGLAAGDGAHYLHQLFAYAYSKAIKDAGLRPTVVDLNFFSQGESNVFSIFEGDPQWLYEEEILKILHIALNRIHSVCSGGLLKRWDCLSLHNIPWLCGYCVFNPICDAIEGSALEMEKVSENKKPWECPYDLDKYLSDNVPACKGVCNGIIIK